MASPFGDLRPRAPQSIATGVTSPPPRAPAVGGSSVFDDLRPQAIAAARPAPALAAPALAPIAVPTPAPERPAAAPLLTRALQAAKGFAGNVGRDVMALGARANASPDAAARRTALVRDIPRVGAAILRDGPLALSQGALALGNVATDGALADEVQAAQYLRDTLGETAGEPATALGQAARVAGNFGALGGAYAASGRGVASLAGRGLATGKGGSRVRQALQFLQAPASTAGRIGQQALAGAPLTAALAADPNASLAVAGADVLSPALAQRLRQNTGARMATEAVLDVLPTAAIEGTIGRLGARALRRDAPADALNAQAARVATETAETTAKAAAALAAQTARADAARARLADLLERLRDTREAGAAARQPTGATAPQPSTRGVARLSEVEEELAAASAAQQAREASAAAAAAGAETRGRDGLAGNETARLLRGYERWRRGEVTTPLAGAGLDTRPIGALVREADTQRLTAQAKAAGLDTPSAADLPAAPADAAAPAATAPAADEAPDRRSIGAVVRAELAQRAAARVARETSPVVADATPARPGFRRAVDGRETDLILPDGQRYRTRYRAVEADDLQPSHNAQTFEPNPLYPAGVQGREYSGPAGTIERERVQEYTTAFDADRVLDATNAAAEGPPVVTPDALVVAGNNRSFLLQRITGESRAAYEQRLQARAAEFGLDPAATKRLVQPRLVRELVPVNGQPFSTETLGRINRASDVPSQKAKDGSQEAASRAAQLTADGPTVRFLADTFPDDGVLSDYLNTKDGREFVQSLTREGVIAREELARLLEPATQTISPEGALQIRRLVAASAINNAAAVTRAPSRVLRKLDSAFVHILRAAAVSPAFDVRRPLGEALELLADADAAGLPLADAVAQTSLLGGTRSPEAAQFAALLNEESGRTIGAKFRAFAARAATSKRTQASVDMFGDAGPDPADARAAVLAPADAAPPVGTDRTPAGSASPRGAATDAPPRASTADGAEDATSATSDAEPTPSRPEAATDKPAAALDEAAASDAPETGQAFNASLFGLDPVAAIRAIGPRAATTIALEGAGAALSQSDDERLATHGRALMALGLVHAIGWRRLTRPGTAVWDAILRGAQQPGAARRLAQFTNPESLLPPNLRAALDAYNETIAKGNARAAELEKEAKALGPQGDRLVSDVVEGEGFEDASTVDPQTIARVLATAERFDQETTALAQELVRSGARTPEQLLNRGQGGYLKRIYAEYAALDALGVRGIKTGARGSTDNPRIGQFKRRTLDAPLRALEENVQAATARLPLAKQELATVRAERLRMIARKNASTGAERDKLAVQVAKLTTDRDALAREVKDADALLASAPQERTRLTTARDATRQTLGEIRESSVRARFTLQAGYRDAASAQVFNVARQTPGTIHPDWQDAMDDLLTARQMHATASTPADKALTRQMADDAKEQMRAVARKFQTGVRDELGAGGQYVTLPETQAFGVLRGAVVKQELAAALIGMADFQSTGAVLRFWKQMKTVANPGTHLGNVSGNMWFAHLAKDGGVPLWEQLQVVAKRGPLWEAGQDLKAYGPAARVLAEAGVLDVNVVSDGTQASRGLTITERELQGILGTTTPQTAKVLRERGITDVSTLQAQARRGVDFARRLYNNEDNLFRVMLYTRAKKLGKSDAEAVAYARQSAVDFRSSSPALRLLRGTVSPFILWSAKALPTAAEAIVERPLQFATLTAIYGVIDQVNRQQDGPVNENDLSPGKRMSSLGYLLPGTVQVGRRNAQGETSMLDIARWTPLSSATQAAPPASLASSVLGDDAPGILAAGGPFVDVLVRAAGNVDPFTGKTWIKASDTAPEKARKLVGAVVNLTTPTILGVWAARVAEDLRNADPAAAATNALGAVGLRPQRVRPGLYARMARRDYENAANDVRYEVRQQLQKNKDPERTAAIIADGARRLTVLRAQFYERIGQTPTGADP